MRGSVAGCTPRDDSVQSGDNVQESRQEEQEQQLEPTVTSPALLWLRPVEPTSPELQEAKQGDVKKEEEDVKQEELKEKEPESPAGEPTPAGGGETKEEPTSPAGEQAVGPGVMEPVGLGCTPQAQAQRWRSQHHSRWVKEEPPPSPVEEPGPGQPASSVEEPPPSPVEGQQPGELTLEQWSISHGDRQVPGPPQSEALVDRGGWWSLGFYFRF